MIAYLVTGGNRTRKIPVDCRQLGPRCYYIAFFVDKSIVHPHTMWVTQLHFYQHNQGFQLEKFPACL